MSCMRQFKAQTKSDELPKTSSEDDPPKTAKPQEMQYQMQSGIAAGFHVRKASKAADGFGLFKYPLCLKLVRMDSML